MGELYLPLLIIWCYLASRCDTASTPRLPQELLICFPFCLGRGIISVYIHSRPMRTLDNPVNNSLSPAEYTKINNKWSQWHSTRSSRARLLVFHFPSRKFSQTLMCCQKLSFLRGWFHQPAPESFSPRTYYLVVFVTRRKSHIFRALFKLRLEVGVLPTGQSCDGIRAHFIFMQMKQE